MTSSEASNDEYADLLRWITNIEYYEIYDQKLVVLSTPHPGAEATSVFEPDPSILSARYLSEQESGTESGVGWWLEGYSQACGDVTLMVYIHAGSQMIDTVGIRHAKGERVVPIDGYRIDSL